MHALVLIACCQCMCMDHALQCCNNVQCGMPDQIPAKTRKQQQNPHDIHPILTWGGK